MTPFDNLPEQSYKVRADFLGQQFWSDPFTWQDTTVTINQGLAAIHVVRSGSDVAGAKVYLFSETGAYLGRYETTNESGKAEFLLPNTSFKFRIDEGGNQYWSPIINIQAGVANNVEVDISPVTVNISADPETIQLGESATLTWSSTHADTCIIEPGIGSVNVNGSILVSPTETTTYTISATGPGGTVTDSIVITVNDTSAPLVSISADPETILSGVSSTLIWSSSNADTCVIEPGIGSVDVNGSTQVAPTQTATYTITATGPGGTATNDVTVTVNYFLETNLIVSDAAAEDNFGQSVSISGDYSIIGVPNDDDEGIDSGSAYIFKREGTTWTQQTKLTANDATAYDYFGWTVSISGDYAVVGAYGDDDGGVDSGSAYIFKREGTTWTQLAKLTANDAAANDYFGHSVSISV